MPDLIDWKFRAEVAERDKQLLSKRWADAVERADLLLTDMTRQRDEALARATSAEETEKKAAIEIESLKDRLAFYVRREEHFALLLRVADSGRYRNDWDAAINRLVKDKGEAVKEKEAQIQVVAGLENDVSALKVERRTLTKEREDLVVMAADLGTQRDNAMQALRLAVAELSEVFVTHEEIYSERPICPNCHREWNAAENNCGNAQCSLHLSLVAGRKVLSEVK